MRVGRPQRAIMLARVPFAAGLAGHDRAQGVFGDVLQHLAVPSFVEDGIVFGPFYEGHEGDCDIQLELSTI
jgi:hypothetical protein